MVIMEAMDLTLQQAADLLDAYRKEHKLARIVDPDECRELDIGEGSCQYGRPCHAVWGSNHRCSNCISYQACHTDKERRKQELRNRQLFEITSRPVNLHVDAATTLVASLELIDWREATPTEVADIPEKDNDNADFLNQHDTLTGLFNKEGFSRAVRAELAAQPDTDFTMVSINLRKFHMINDLYSMKKGDEVLVSVAESIRQKCHTGALIARLFGDHFAVFEPTDETLEARLQEFLDEALFVIEEDDIHAGIYAVVDRNLPVAI
ncbi:MAG: GGDEF domain-containing protein, partial [Selenomonas sp.]